MSVLDRGYRRWRGTPTPYLQRVLVIPRYDVQEILGRKVWLISYVGCLVPPLILGVVAYFTTNLALIRTLLPMLPAQLELPTPGADTYAAITTLQLSLAMAYALLVGPPLATRDFANQAMPLFLSKALRRFDYVIGRWAVLLVLLSLASWVPLLLVFGLQHAMSKPAWREANDWVAVAIVVGSLPVVVLMTALVTAVSAWVHRANLARFLLLVIILVTPPVALTLEGTLGSPFGRVVSPLAMAATVHDRAFEPPAPDDAVELTREPGRGGRAGRRTEVPLGVALALLAAWIGGCVAVLGLRVRPVEVVR